MSDSKIEFHRRRGSYDIVIVALLTFTLCVAMNVAIFAVIHSALLRFLPFPTPDLLVTVFEKHPTVEVKPYSAGAAATTGGDLTADYADSADKKTQPCKRFGLIRNIERFLLYPRYPRSNSPFSTSPS